MAGLAQVAAVGWPVSAQQSLLQLGFRQPGEEHFAQGRAVQRKTFSDPGIDSDRLIAFNFREIDRLSALADAQMAGELQLGRQSAEQRQRFGLDKTVVGGESAQLRQLQPQHETAIRAHAQKAKP